MPPSSAKPTVSLLSGSSIYVSSRPKISVCFIRLRVEPASVRDRSRVRGGRIGSVAV